MKIDTLHAELILKVKLSLWSAIKLRIAGINSDMDKKNITIHKVGQQAKIEITNIEELDK